MKCQGLYPHLPLPVILPMECLTSPKADVQHFTNIFCNQAQLLSRTNRADEVTFHEGWSLSVSEEQRYLCSMVVGFLIEIQDHNTLKLRQCIFNNLFYLIYKIQGIYQIIYIPGLPEGTGHFQFCGSSGLPWQFCIQTFGKWLQGLDLLHRFGDLIFLCIGASCISNSFPIPYAEALPPPHSKAPKSALQQPRMEHRMSRLSAKEIWHLKWLTSAVSMGRRK